jgi:hypothetical protein
LDLPPGTAACVTARAVSTESRALQPYPYTFFSRYGEKPETNSD